MLETTETSPLAVPRYRSVEARRAKPGEGERRIIEAPNCIAPEAPDPKMWYDGATALSRGRSTRPATPPSVEAPPARKWRRNGLKRLNPRPEMAVSRKSRTHNIWYKSTRRTVRDSG
jgi:hypothetical protein